MADRPSPSQIPLAIIGMGCRLPGADNLEQYWRLVVEGRSAVVELPADRLDQDMYFDPEVGVRGKTYSKLGAIISSRQFDRARCPIDERLAKSVDNAHLLMCDVAASALKHAGFDPFQMPIKNTGVFIGHAQGSTLGGDHTYASCIAEAAEFLADVPAFAGLPQAEQKAFIRELVDRVRRPLAKREADSPDVSASLVAGTISKAFGLDGPYLAINSACASSLQAMLLGARALQLGRVEMAIVGGASDCKSDSLVLFSNARAMSSTGTRPFDTDADGLICGEGYVALVMKTLDRAVADGDRVLAVVRGLGVSSDGKGKSLWAPRKEGQMKAMERAYRDGLDVADLDYVEAHATATQLGDATELNTLTEILAGKLPQGKRIPITSVKANIGHTLETAGIAGVIKTVLAMQNNTVPPACNVQNLNSKIDWQKAPVFVPMAPAPWPKRADGKPRRAGVNAFGIGGLNMHVVVDEHLPEKPIASVAIQRPASEAIAVIGLGCVLPGAANPAEFWQLLSAGRDPKMPIPKDRWRPDIAIDVNDPKAPRGQSLVGGFVTGFEYDWKRHKVPPKQVAQADPLQFMLLEATDQAMHDAGYDQKPFVRENVGVVVGTEFGGDFSFQLQIGLRLPELERHIEAMLVARGWQPTLARQLGKDYSEALLARWPSLIDETGSFSTSSLASRIGKTWNLMGGAAAIDAGETSGLAALSTSIDMLQGGDCDLMICAAGQRRMAWPQYESLAKNGTLAGGSPRSPLDAQAAGQVPGEGVVVLLLKRLADAQRDNDHIHAVLHGVGAGHDASSWGNALQKAIERSFASSAVRPADVALMELDALGTPAATADEVRAVAAVYGQQPRQKPLLMSSAVGQIGNTQGASSLVSMLKAVLEISNGELPPAVGLGSPMNAIATSGSLSAPTMRTALEVTSAGGRRLAAVGSCSRGLAYHAVMEYGSPVAAPAVAPVVQQPVVAAAAAPAAAAPAPASSSVNLAELEKFLIQFVVEQTGYPAEVVELDADLEADLGIDSIKKAQMFGELQEYFDVTPTDNLTLDDFPTLRHIVNFLAKAPAKASAPVAAAPAPVVPAAPAPAPAAAAPAPAAASAASASFEICRFGAVDAASLRGMLEAAVNDANGWQTSRLRKFSSADQFRLAIVAESAAVLATRIGLALKQMDNPASQTVLEQQGIFYRQANPDTRIALLFPGQGSQYTGMLKQLVADSPAVASEERRINGVMGRLGFPTWPQLAYDAASPLGKDVWTTQISMLLGDLLMLAALKERGINPDLVAGHSYGEYAALFAAGCWELEQAAQVTRWRCESIDAEPSGQGGMLATTAPPEIIEQLAAQVSGPVYAANHNAPDQTVVGGTLAALAQLEPLLQGSLFETRKLPVPCPFHTPLMQGAADRFARHMASQSFQEPRVPLYSVATNDVARAATIGKNLVAHLTTPVRYADLVRKLAAQAPTVFVEVGPQQALTKLNRRNFAGAEFSGIACDNPSRPGIEQIVRVQAMLEASGAMDRERKPAAPAASQPVVSVPKTSGQIWQFDATARRREKKTRQAAGKPAAMPGESRIAPPAAPSKVSSNGSNGNGHAGHAMPERVPVGASLAPAPPPRSAAPAASAPAAPPAPAPAPTPPAPAPAAKVNLAELEKFLIQFVVEQTGYPAEVVELDADLEADLGIDSIKKAQMFGELQEYFDVTPTDNLTLDDFPTLRHIVNFLATAPSKATAPAKSGARVSAAPAAASTPAPVMTAPAAPAPVAAPAVAAPPAARNGVDMGELEKFLIQFVVEQTGYPAEVVELDADLEADLGIDSIKKAQMFGELQEYFDVTPTDNLTLDDFPTLRHIVNFLAAAPAKAGAPVAAAAAPASPPAPAVAAMAAPAPVMAQATATTPAKSGVEVGELERFLIQFVVEQTGYPAEVVELDADLEADLGIDSIKKAQMFGELQEYFDVTPTDNLTLDDFPTLRHIVTFLAAAPAKAGAPVASVQAAAGGAAAAAPPIAASTAPATAPPQIDVLHLRGTAYEQGQQQGDEKKNEIRAALRRMSELTDGQLDELPIPPGARKHPEKFFTPEQFEELRGLADAVGVPLGNLAALNLAVLGDLPTSAGQIVYRTDAGSMLHGLRAELSLPVALVEMLKPVVLVREAARGWSSASVTFAGIVGSLIGTNGNGLSATGGLPGEAKANTASQPAFSVEALLQTSSDAAEAVRRLGGQNAEYCFSQVSANQLAHVECNAAGARPVSDQSPVVAADSAARRSELQALGQPADALGLLSALEQLPSQGTLQLNAVIDSQSGDLLVQCGKLRERVHVGPLVRSTFVGEPFPVETVSQPAAAPTSNDLADPRDDDAESMRFVLRLVPTEWKTAPADFPTFKGAAAVYGPGAIAEALHKRLLAGGATVVRLAEADTIEQAIAELESQWAHQPITHLFLCSHTDGQTLDRTNPTAFDALYRRRVLVPYFLTQRMLQLAGESKRLDDCTVVATVDLGGDLGFSGRVETPESGFLTGFIKSLLLEYNIMRLHKGFLSKAVDAPRDESPDLLAANILRELAYGSNDYEVVFVGGKRYLQVALPAPVQLESESKIKLGGTWVLTGGARGITAECGLALARRFGLKLHLIGTTPLAAVDPAWRSMSAEQFEKLKAQVIIDARKAGEKPNEAWARVAKAIEIDRNLQAFATAGVKATYHACDVTDRAALAAVLDKVRAADGPIHGVLHGAGIEVASRFEKKSSKVVLATIGAKALAAHHLMTLTINDPISHFIGFGSISGRLGSNGQTDYAAASDFLAKLITWYRGVRPECRAIAWHWHPWDEVGMASRPETEATLKASKLRLMPKTTGIRHLLKEMYAGQVAGRPLETELLVTDWEYHQRYYPKNYAEIARKDDLLGVPGAPAPSGAGAAMEPASDAAKSGVASRVVMRMNAAPLAGEGTGALPSAVYLLGENADAEALAARLSSAGVQVMRLPIVDHQSAPAAVDAAWSQLPARCLIITTSRDTNGGQLGDRAAAARRVERGVDLPYWITRRWFQLVSKEESAGPATLVALTSLGGDFGFGGDVPSPEGGAMAGLLKSIFVEDARYEHQRFCVKVIDFPQAEPAVDAATAVCRELTGTSPEVEVAWSGESRSVVSTERVPVKSLPLSDITRGGNWVVTGGGRGITAAAAMSLAKRYGLKLHLVGKSPAPAPTAPWRDCSDEELKAIKANIVRTATLEGRSPTDDWDRVRKDREICETLASFAAEGVTAHYHSCDVSDWDDVARMLAEIRAQDGPIHGIVHGAGYAKSFRFGTGTGDKVKQTLAPKIDGTLALMHLSAHDPLEYFVAFGSLSGRFGGNGLSDYAAANEMLAKLCGWYRHRRPSCKATCFHWQTWDQIGMAMLADGVGITKNAFKMDFIPPAEGEAHFVDEIRAGAPENEVLITDGYFQKVFYPYQFDRPVATSTPKSATRTGSPLIEGFESLSPLPAEGEGLGVRGQRHATARIHFDPVADPFLAQHRLKQRPFLPGVIGIESLLESASIAMAGASVHEVRNVRITNGLMFSGDSPIAARVEVVHDQAGVNCRLLTELRDRQGRLIDGNRLHAEGTIPMQVEAAITVDPPGRPPLGWFKHQYPDDGLMYHGAPLRLLEEVAYQYDGGWGRIVAAPLADLAGMRGGEGWVLPTAVLDACVVACGSFLYLQFGGVLEVPFGFDELRWTRLPRAGENCIVRLYFRGRDERHSRFEFTLYGDADEPILQAVGYQTVRVGAGGR